MASAPFRQRDNVAFGTLWVVVPSIPFSVCMPPTNRNYVEHGNIRSKGTWLGLSYVFPVALVAGMALRTGLTDTVIRIGVITMLLRWRGVAEATE